MVRFRKPHITSLFPAAAKPCQYPYPGKMLRRYDIFPLFVLDGGAFFFTMEHIGGATGAAFLAAWKDGSLLQPWSVDGQMHWDKAYDDTCASSCQTTLEKHVWLNRLYFLLPVAQEFFRTGDEKWARLWYRYLIDWLGSHPHSLKGTAQPGGRGNYCWFDMQVTWRLLVLIHSVRLLEKSRFLGEKHWLRIYKAIHLHSRLVHENSSAALLSGTGKGNHFLQKGNALLYAGILFPEFPESAEFIRMGKGIVEQQMGTEILPDGGSVEGCPSYSHFIARLYLDSYLLLKDNGYANIPGLRRCIQRQYRHLATMATPQELTMQVSDSYALDVPGDLAIVRELFPIPKTYPKKSMCFHDSRMAVLRNRRFAVYVDGMETGLWHHHPGKPNMLVFVDGAQLLIDSGCCNYDRDLRSNWLQTEAAHNVVVVVPQEATELHSPLPEPAVVLREFTSRKVVMEHTFEQRDWQYVWTRTLFLSAKKVRILDRIRASIPVRAEQHFHIAPLNVSLAAKRKKAIIQMERGDVAIERTNGSSRSLFDLTYKPAIGADNRDCASAHLFSMENGRNVDLEVQITLAD
jgi:hypothetical protein